MTMIVMIVISSDDSQIRVDPLRKKLNSKINDDNVVMTVIAMIMNHILTNYIKN